LGVVVGATDGREEGSPVETEARVELEEGLEEFGSEFDEAWNVSASIQSGYDVV
jgi:hypothetical protein